jgi:hypothetical protein
VAARASAPATPGTRPSCNQSRECKKTVSHSSPWKRAQGATGSEYSILVGHPNLPPRANSCDLWGTYPIFNRIVAYKLISLLSRARPFLGRTRIRVVPNGRSVRRPPTAVHPPPALMRPNTDGRNGRLRGRISRRRGARPCPGGGHGSTRLGSARANNGRMSRRNSAKNGCLHDLDKCLCCLRACLLHRPHKVPNPARLHVRRSRQFDAKSARR